MQKKLIENKETLRIYVTPALSLNWGFNQLKVDLK